MANMKLKYDRFEWQYQLRKYFFLTMTRLKVEGEVGSNFDEHESERS